MVDARRPGGLNSCPRPPSRPALNGPHWGNFPSEGRGCADEEIPDGVRALKGHPAGKAWMLGSIDPRGNSDAAGATGVGPLAPKVYGAHMEAGGREGSSRGRQARPARRPLPCCPSRADRADAWIVLELGPYHGTSTFNVPWGAPVDAPAWPDRTRPRGSRRARERAERRQIVRVHFGA